LPLLYSNDNPPPSIRIIVLLLTFFLAINTFNWLVTQELYLDREIDVALSDEDNVGLNEPIGDDAEGNGVPSAETLALNPIRSNSAGETHPSAADQAVPTAPSSSGQKKKRVVQSYSFYTCLAISCQSPLMRSHRIPRSLASRRPLTSPRTLQYY
jgi:hypothetical protein